MSLINEMLRDLDARSQPAETRDVADNIAILPGHPAKSPLLFIVSGLVLVAVLGFYLVQPIATTLWLPKQKAEDPLPKVASLSSAKEIAVVDRVAVVDPMDVLSEEISEPTDENNVPAPVVEQIVTETEPKVIPETQPAENRNDIDHWLSAADLALKENRLSIPSGASAYDLYRRVLAVDPGNTAALSGIGEIKTRYLHMVDEALDENKTRRARRLIERIESLSLDVSSEQLLAYRDRLQRQPQLAVSNPQPKDEARSAGEEQPLPDSYLAINKTQVSREQVLAREAQQLLARGRGREAAQLLENFIADNANANLSRLILFDYYLGQARPVQATALMEPEDAMHAATLAYMKARLAMMSSGPAAAISILENQKPLDSIRETYNAFLAGLYQKAKVHDRAAGLYAELIESNPTSVTYWLGMAVSRDALGEHLPALNAYNVVIAHKNLDESVRGFVRARIQALSSARLSSNKSSNKRSSNRSSSHGQLPRELAEAGSAW